MASNPLFIIPDLFFCIFQTNYLRFEGNEFLWKMQRKTWYSISGLDDMPLSLKNLLLKKFYLNERVTTFLCLLCKLKYHKETRKSSFVKKIQFKQF